MNEVNYQYVVSDYYATGEGRTVSILVTRALPQSEDYDDHYEIRPGHTPKLRAAREFLEVFDNFTISYARNITSEEFRVEYYQYLPDMVIRILDDVEQPGNFQYYSQVHVNFS